MSRPDIPFGSSHGDHVSASDERRDAIRSALKAEWWEAFCADASAWPQASEAR